MPQHALSKTALPVIEVFFERNKGRNMRIVFEADAAGNPVITSAFARTLYNRCSQGDLKHLLGPKDVRPRVSEEKDHFSR